MVFIWTHGHLFQQIIKKDSIGDEIMLLAGIVLYNPNIGRLKENLSAITPQVDKVILVDNGSNNFICIEGIINQYENIVLINNSENLGVARALNQIMDRANEFEAMWVLTLDQDSICSPDLIRKYEIYTDVDGVASISCQITDRNFEYENYEGNDIIFIQSCITSGNYIKISVWKKLEGFDENLFIDKVDTDYCFRLVHKGWKILQIPYKGMLHEVGKNTRTIYAFGKKITVFNHSAFRVYYLIRNQIYFARKHKNNLGSRSYYRYIRTAWARIFVYLIWENEKIEKMKAWKKGIIDGYKMQIHSE